MNNDELAPGAEAMKWYKNISVSRGSLEMMGTVFTQGTQWVRTDFHLRPRADREFRYSLLKPLSLP